MDSADSLPVKYEDILRKAGVFMTETLEGTLPATATNYEAFFTATCPLEILAVAETHRVASVSGTLNLEILKTGMALDSGSTVLTTAFSTSGTANTPVIKNGTALSANRILKTGDRLALKDGGTLTNSAGLSVTVYFKFANRGDFS